MPAGQADASSIRRAGPRGELSVESKTEIRSGGSWRWLAAPLRQAAPLASRSDEPSPLVPNPRRASCRNSNDSTRGRLHDPGEPRQRYAGGAQAPPDAIAQGKTFSMIALEDVPDEWLTVVPAGMGGGGAWEHVIDRAKSQNIPLVPDATVRAVQALSKHIGKKFNAAIRVEAGNASLTTLLAAHDLGLPVVDACLSGRSRPEIQQQIPSINGIPAPPAAMVTRWGDTVIIDQAVDDYRLEDIGRGIAVASGGGSAIAMNVMSGRDRGAA